MKLLRWILDNKEWIFSGGGVAVMGGAIALWRKSWQHAPAPTQATTTQVENLQAGRDINIGFSPAAGESGMSTSDLDGDLLCSLTALTAEMKSDLLGAGNEFVREFFVLPNHRVILGGSNKPRFIYYEDDHPDLRNQLDLLEERGFVRDVTPFGNNVPIYRMTDKLVLRLRNTT